jgi:hypothetical protein
MSSVEAAASASAGRDVGTPSELTRALDKSIERAKQRRGMRPCRISLAKDPVAFYNARPEMLWYAIQSGAPIPPELKQGVENMRRYERRHPGELDRLAAQVTREERDRFAPSPLRLRLPRARRRGAGRPAVRGGARVRRGGDSGDSDPDLADEPPSRWRRSRRCPRLRAPPDRGTDPIRRPRGIPDMQAQNTLAPNPSRTHGSPAAKRVPPLYAVVAVHWDRPTATGIPACVEECSSLEAVADAVVEMIRPHRWVSVIGFTGTAMRPLARVEEIEVIRLLTARDCEVEDTARSGNAFMVQAKLLRHHATASATRPDRRDRKRRTT